MDGVDGGSTRSDTISDAMIVDALLDRLERGSPGATACPSEIARTLATAPSAWRALMPRVRAAAQRLATEGRLRVTRQGVEVDATSAGGPIRLGRPTRKNAP